ncbi:unnamed protein product [Lactuca virosa]|uniref:Uncharacterized protein n=1 Tax=Lactuca virosa TaxID=75947 RepID=A0AAU9NDQ8_9ASTR|nr:unnamed protein product [Lactuca virosa]
MESPVKGGLRKKNFLIKTWERCRSIPSSAGVSDAEVEYGYDTPGPILLPCEVDLFYRVVAEMETMEMEPHGCKLRYGSCSPFNPSRRLINAGGDQMVKGYGGYGLLTPSRLVKMN